METICLYVIDLYFPAWRNPEELRHVMNRGGLESALGAPRQSFEGKEFFQTIQSKAACLFRSLIKNHPFIEGNKRTAVVATHSFVRVNGYDLTVRADEFYKLAIQVAESQDYDAILRDLEAWFTQRTQRSRP